MTNSTTGKGMKKHHQQIFHCPLDLTVQYMCHIQEIQLQIPSFAILNGISTEVVSYLQSNNPFGVLDNENHTNIIPRSYWNILQLTQRIMPIKNVWFVIKRKKGMRQHMGAVNVMFPGTQCLCFRLYHSHQVHQVKEETSKWCKQSK